MMSRLEKELSQLSSNEGSKAVILSKEGRFIEAHDCMIRKEAFAEAARLVEKYFKKGA